jgi:hypothetical protein
LSNYDPNDGHTHTMPQQPVQTMPPQGYGYGMQPWGMRQRRTWPIETKPFFLTSEFILSLIVSIGIAITAASSHAFGGWRAWVLIATITASYNLSRGIAKAGTRSHASDPRENVDLSRGHDHDGHSH